MLAEIFIYLKEENSKIRAEREDLISEIKQFSQQIVANIEVILSKDVTKNVYLYFIFLKERIFKMKEDYTDKEECYDAEIVKLKSENNALNEEVSFLKVMKSLLSKSLKNSAFCNIFNVLCQFST